MRTTLDLPDPLFRELKSQAARNGQSLKTLINDLILRGMRSPIKITDTPTDMPFPAPPILARLNTLTQAGPTLAAMQTSESELEEDLDKLRRSGFLK